MEIFSSAFLVSTLAVEEKLNVFSLQDYCTPGPLWLCTLQARPCMNCRSQCSSRAAELRTERSHKIPRHCFRNCPILPESTQSSSSATSYAALVHIGATPCLVNSSQFSLSASFAATMMSTPMGLRTYAPNAFTGPRPFSRIAGTGTLLDGALYPGLGSPPGMSKGVRGADG